ncbi:MAG: carboxypeptidase regulatory-like domain-containing protein [Planctomycetes bacterium]|nr:carboxypeptidase regulatory-like domain-containing protein [Planctomycetota bacterium]
MPEFVPSGMTRFPRLWSALAGLVLGLLLGALGWQWLGTPAPPQTATANLPAADPPPATRAAPALQRAPTTSHEPLVRPQPLPDTVASKSEIKDAAPASAETDAGIDPWGPLVPFRACIEGLVVDQAENPVAGAQVSAQLLYRLQSAFVSAEANGEEEDVATTDSLGRFTYALDFKVGKFARLTALLRAHMEGFESSPAARVQIADGDAKANVKLLIAARGSIHGRIVGPNGRALAGATVGTYSPNARIWVAANQVLTNANGGSLIEDLAAGHYGISVQCEGHARPPATLVALVTPGERHELSEIALHRLTQLVGRVITPQGESVTAQVTIEFLTRDGNSLKTANCSPDGDGRFTLIDPPTGDLRIKVSAAGFQALSERAESLQPEETTDLGTITLTQIETEQ